MPSNPDDRRGGPRSGDGARRGQNDPARRGKGGAGRSGAGGGKQGGQRGQGGGPRARKPATTGENGTVQQLTGPLQKVLARLPATQRKVLELRMGLVDGHPHDLADTARELGLSLSEARDIEQRAFAHIREAVPLQQLQRFLPKS
jgi:hypothetical protein